MLRHRMNGMLHTTGSHHVVSVVPLVADVEPGHGVSDVHHCGTVAHIVQPHLVVVGLLWALPVVLNHTRRCRFLKRPGQVPILRQQSLKDAEA
jgi:hypothetical protein